MNNLSETEISKNLEKEARNNFLGVATSILVDFWIFSDQAQLLDPESAASKEPRSGLVARIEVDGGSGRD